LRAPDQSGRLTDATTPLSSTMKPGKLRLTQALEVIVVRHASVTATSPIAMAPSRIERRARGLVGKASALAIVRHTD
jgi:hypothetical protein